MFAVLIMVITLSSKAVAQVNAFPEVIPFFFTSLLPLRVRFAFQAIRRSFLAGSK